MRAVSRKTSRCARGNGKISHGWESSEALAGLARGFVRERYGVGTESSLMWGFERRGLGGQASAVTDVDLRQCEFKVRVVVLVDGNGAV